MERNEWISYLEDYISEPNDEDVMIDASEAQELVDLLKEDANAEA